MLFDGYTISPLWDESSLFAHHQEHLPPLLKTPESHKTSTWSCFSFNQTAFLSSLLKHREKLLDEQEAVELDSREGGRRISLWQNDEVLESSRVLFIHPTSARQHFFLQFHSAVEVEKLSSLQSFGSNSSFFPLQTFFSASPRAA